MNYSLRPYQLNKVAEARAMMGSGKKSICLVSPTGSGKCLGQGTPVLMYDGQIKTVEDIVAGDRLMGPDSGPRNVLSVCSGSEMLYRVTPVKGDPYVVNASHILSLKRTHEPNVKKTGKRDRGGEIVNLSVTEYLGKSATFKHLHKGWRTGVDFKNQELFLIDPYFLGLWLGDGTQRTSAITTGDHEIIDWVIEYSKYLRIKYRIENNSENSVNIHITTGIRGANNGGNPIVNALDRYGLRQIKHVPHAYKTASRYDRLKLLAGFIDADGSLQAGGYDVVGINERLIDDIIFVARSLGFAAYKSPCKKTCGNNGKTGNYFRCNINGNTDEIPCLIERKKAAPRRQKKSVLVTGITVEPIGVGRYYGFEIDGDRLFMLGDFTVTHNTVIAAHIILSALSKGRRVLFLAHRRELINQCADKLNALGVLDYNVILPRHPQSNNPTSQMHIASIQTLIRREYPKADLIIVDEAHHAAARQYKSLLSSYPDAYVLGLTATPERLDWKGLDDIFQDLLEVATVPQLIEQGFLVKPTCLSPSREMAEKIKESLSGLKIRGGDYDEGELGDAMDNKVLIGDIIEHWKEWAFGQKTIVFAASILHSQHIVEQFTNAGITAAHIDGKMSMSERERILSAWRTPELDVVSNCQILCLDEKTEILTDSGWYGIDDINAQSRVANWDNGSIFFEEPLDIFKRDRGVDERMFSIHHHSARVTEGHNILAASGRKQDVWKKRPVESLAGKSYAMPVSGLAPPKPIDLPEQSFPKSNRGRLVAALSYHLRKTHGMPSVEARNEAINRVDTRHSMRYTPVDKLTEEQCRLIGLFHADGTKTPLHKGGVEFRFSTSKHQPFIVEAFNRVFDGVDFHRIGREKQSTIDWSFSRGTGGGSQKRAGVFEIEIYLEKGNLDFLWGLNEHQFDAFIYGFWLGDGNHGNDGIYNHSTKTICLFQENQAVLDIIQAVAVCRKYKSYLSYKSNGKKFRIGTLFLSKKSTHRISSRHSWVEESSYKPERVWCVKTSSGNIITRRNGSVTVMGNCEGFDYPELSCCIQARPTKSLALHLQMVGRIMRVANGKNGAIILDHAGNIAEHGVPHAERIWTLEGSAKKRKPEKPHACFMPGCGAMFVESDAGAILWIAEDQSGIIENYRFIARKFENVDAGSTETKLIVCPLCHHASCKFCGEFIHDQVHTGNLVCENCQGVYVRSRPIQEGKAGREIPECADGTLELVDDTGEANDKIVVKNEYHRLLNVAGKKGFNRGWVWHRLTEKFSEDQLRCLPRHPRGWWKQPASEQ